MSFMFKEIESKYFFTRKYIYLKNQQKILELMFLKIYKANLNICLL